MHGNSIVKWKGISKDWLSVIAGDGGGEHEEGS